MNKNNQLDFFGIIFDVKDNTLILDKTNKHLNMKRKAPQAINNLIWLLRKKEKENDLYDYADQKISLLKREQRNKNIREFNLLIKEKQEDTECISKCLEMCENINKYIKYNKCIERINYYGILPRDLTEQEDDIIYECMKNQGLHVFNSMDIAYLKKSLKTHKKMVENYETIRISIADQYK